MTNTKSKASEARSEKQEPAGHHTDAIMAKYLPEGADRKTPEEWDAHDRAIEVRREAEDARAHAKWLSDRGKKLIACGAPERPVGLITSGKVEKDKRVMDDLDEWQQSERQICVLSGPVGVGKTVAAIRWLANFGGLSPFFVRAGDFEAQGRYDKVLRSSWQNATGMILDDLSAEYRDAKGNLLADLDTLIDTFSAGHGRLIITTNSPWGSQDPTVVSFEARYEERIASRIVGSATWINVSGPDLRRAG